jgi:hypothetical protein
MSSLLSHLAYGRIERPRLFVTYLVGLAVGAAVAIAVLLAFGISRIPLID